MSGGFSMKLIATVLVCVLSLGAQIVPTLKTISNGSREVRVRNDSEKTVVAFAVTIAQTPQSPSASSAPLVVWSDSLIEPSDKPLPAGEERMILRRNAALSEPIVVAAICDDGSTLGDRLLLARIMARRSNMLLAADMTIETLRDAGQRNVPRAQLIEQFRRLVASAHRWYLPPEQQVGQRLYQSVIGKLTNLPDAPLGSPFPPSSFVAEEIASLNRLRVSLLESKPSLADAFLVTGR